MSGNEELRQALLELHYDLLDDEQARQLRSAIATDPETATLWAQTLRLAGQFADAAKIDTAKVNVPDASPAPHVTESSDATASPEATEVATDGMPPVVDTTPSRNGSASGKENDEPILAELVEATIDDSDAAQRSGDEPWSTVTPANRNSPADDSQPTQPHRGRSRWWVRSTGVAVTAALIGCVIFGFSYRQAMPAAPAPALQLSAQVNAGDDATGEPGYQFVARQVDGTALGGSLPMVPASLSYSVLAHGTILFRGETETDPSGKARVILPESLTIPEGAQLKVTASSSDERVIGSTLEVPLEPTRCLTYLTVDRPVYRPGETIFFRSLTLQRQSLRADVDVPIRFELLDPSGAIVAGAFLEGVTDRGVGNGSFPLPSSAAGGPYTLVAKSMDGFFPDERCELQVRSYRVPQFKKELEFRRRSYGAGEKVHADLSVQRASGGPLVDARLIVTATVDGMVIYRGSANTSDVGTAAISFDLPDHIGEGQGRLSISIDDGSMQETQSKTIPIQLGRVEVDFYPEGGYLVEGLVNRVYFAARDTLGKPIHLSGEILTRSGEQVATVETVRDGMGRFEFRPRRGERYQLKVLQPVDVTNSPSLPSVVKDLPVLDTGSGVFAAGESVRCVVRSHRERSILLRAVCRGQLVGQQELTLRPGDNSVSVAVNENAAGVIRLTIHDGETRRPLIERLVFRRQPNQLYVDVVEPDSELNRSPGQPLRLTLQVRDESGQPTSAVLGVSVVDDAALSLLETEKPHLRTHFLLTSEIEKPEDLEHANFYLESGDEAAESLDLLLGTQGWRRFVSGPADQADVDFREQLVRLLELDGDPMAVAPGTFENSPPTQREWSRYHALASIAWDKLLWQLRLLALSLLLIWLAATIVHLRHQSRSTLASWWLIAVTSLLLYGCSAQEASIVSATSQESDDAQMAAEMAEEAAAEDVARAMPEPESPTLSAPAENRMDEVVSQRADATADQESAAGATDSAGPAFGAAFGAAASEGDEGFGDRTEPIDTEFSGDSSHRKSDVSVLTEKYANGRAITPEELRQLLAARGLDADALADQLLDELRFPVRQYAHRHATAAGEVREDFTETLYWQPLVTTDSKGRATIRFDLSDSVTSFRVAVDGHTADGRIGSGGGIVTSRLPFQIEPKLPLEVTTGDRIDLPVAVINATDQAIGVDLDLTVGPEMRLKGQAARVLSLDGEQRQRELFSLDVVEGKSESDVPVLLRGAADGSLSDQIRRTIHVAPAGYPSRRSVAGVLEERAVVRLPLPDRPVEGSLSVTLRAYPSPLADVMSGVESILREPHGCFEQTSATNYPNAMALAYMDRHDLANPDVTRRARGMLDRGYDKLTSFECTKRGYEWFGKDPGHEALSAFGLMQFTDMGRIMNVNGEMIQRTRQWLMSRRDQQGGFLRNPRHLHVWSVQQPIVNAYVLWAITEADVAAGHDHRAARELAAELDEMARVAAASDDAYLIALSAAALMNVKRTDEGIALLETLAKLQHEDGSLKGKTTVTSSGGLSLKMETTAIATLAWVKHQAFRANANHAAKWITSNRQGNAGFGSTQATVLALKALLAVADQSKRAESGGTLMVKLQGEEIARATISANADAASAVEISGLGGHLQDAGEETEIELSAPGLGHLSYTIDIAYHATMPESDPSCPLQVSTRLVVDGESAESVAAGETMTVETTINNVVGQGQPMSIAIVGLPGGVEPQVARLDELMEAETFDYYELRGRDVIFYWRSVEPAETKVVKFPVTAAIPGRYTGPASRAYLYYTAEEKRWAEPLSIEIMP